MHVWLTVAEASPILKMSQQAIYTALREHQIPEAAILRIGRRIRIDPAALVQVSTKGGKFQSDENDAGESEASHAAG